MPVGKPGPSGGGSRMARPAGGNSYRGKPPGGRAARRSIAKDGSVVSLKGMPKSARGQGRAMRSGKLTVEQVLQIKNLNAQRVKNVREAKERKWVAQYDAKTAKATAKAARSSGPVKPKVRPMSSQPPKPSRGLISKVKRAMG